MENQLAGRGTLLRDRVFMWLLFISLAIGVLTLAILLIYVTVKGWPRLDIRLFTNMPSVRDAENAGAQSAITGTIWVISFTALIALPTGILAALHLEEFAKPDSRFQRFIEINIQNLAAVPSIVYGILGLAVFARALALGQSVITASLTLALLVLPVIIISTPG